MKNPALTVPFHSSARRCPARCSGSPPRASSACRQRPVIGAEQHRLQPRPPPSPSTKARIVLRLLPDPVGPHHPRARQHQHRLLVARPERRQPRRAAAPDRSSPPATASVPSTARSAAAGSAARRRQPLVEEGVERRAAASAAARTPPPSRGRRRSPGCPACRAAITAAPRSSPGTDRPRTLRHAVGQRRRRRPAG